MPYTTAIFDRTQTDIDNKTSKAYMNVADWTRIYDNTFFVKDLVKDALVILIPFDTIATPTTSTIPTVTDVNKLTANIERIRIEAGVIGTEKEIKDDWEAGASKEAPNYIDVNLWEKTLDLIHTAYLISPVRFARTGIAKTGVGKTRNNKWRHYA